MTANRGRNIPRCIPADKLDWIHRSLSDVERFLANRDDDHGTRGQRGRVAKVLDYLEELDPELAEAEE